LKHFVLLLVVITALTFKVNPPFCFMSCPFPVVLGILDWKQTNCTGTYFEVWYLVVM